MQREKAKRISSEEGEHSDTVHSTSIYGVPTM